MSEKKLLCTEDLYRYEYLSTPDYCPANGCIAYVVSRPDKNTGKYEKRIYIRKLQERTIQPDRAELPGWLSRINDTDKPDHTDDPNDTDETGYPNRSDDFDTIRITAGGFAEDNPRFSSDGKKLLFLSDVTGTRQIWVRDLESGILTQETTMRYGVSDPAFSPGADRIVFLSAAPEGESEELLTTEFTDDDRQAFERKKQKEAVVVEDFGYKSEEAFGFAGPEYAKMVWMKDLDQDRPVRLTDGDRDHVMPVFSPDGRYLVFASNREMERSEFLGMDLYRMDADGKNLMRLTDSLYVAYYPKKIVPRFTPDGKNIVVGGYVPEGDGLPPAHLFLVPADGGESRRVFCDGAPCDGTTRFLYNAENYGGAYETMQVGSDGKYAYFVSGWHGAGNLYRVNLDGEPVIEAFTQGRHNYSTITPPSDGLMYALRTDEFHTYEIWSVDEVSGEERCVVKSNEWLSEYEVSPMRELTIHTLDGKADVQGWVVGPAGAVPGKKYPALLYIHGGPTPYYGYAFTHEYQCIAAKGIAVILVNPRGSTGYGPKHGGMREAFDGTACYDLLQFVDEASKTFAFIDPERIGVCGGSYGGYMTNWMVTHCKRFKAAAAHRSICNELISYASSDMAGGCGVKEYADYGDFLVDMMKKSAVTYAQNVDVPLLILHSTGDMRCPVEQAHQFYTAVKDTHPDLPVRMVLFPDSNHGLMGEGPVYLQIIHMNENIGWFVKYL